MNFKTKIDYSNNRQIKQFNLTNTQLSGTTTFGVSDVYIPLNFTGNTINIDALQYIRTRGLILANDLPTYTGNTFQILGRDGSSGVVVPITNINANTLDNLDSSDFVRTTDDVNELITGIKTFLGQVQFDGVILVEEDATFGSIVNLSSGFRFQKGIYEIDFDANSLTTNRLQRLQNKDGTIALTSDINKINIDALGIDAGSLTGTLADARLSSNVPLKNGNNVFTGENAFGGDFFVDTNINSNSGLITLDEEIKVNGNMRLGSGVYYSLIRGNQNTDIRDFVFPDKSGTIALTNDINKTAIDALGINATTLLGLTPAEIIDLLTGVDIALKLFLEDNINEFTDAEKAKLATVESSKWLGEYASLTALNAAHPSPNPPGSYANVDGGAGADVKRYLWDVTDNAFVIQEGTASNLTDAQIKAQYEANADTEVFTTAEQSKLASITAIFTSALKTAYDNAVTWISTNGTNLLNHLTNTSNPHSVTKDQVGLPLVPNLDTTNAVNNEHTHSNKNVLDNITEAFTTTLKNAYDGAVTDSHTHTNKPILDNIENLLNEKANLSTANKFTQQQIIEGTLSIPLVLSHPTYKAWVLHRPNGAGEEGALIFAPNLATGNYVDGNNVDWAKQVKFDDGYVTAVGFKTRTAATGFLKADGTVDNTTYVTALTTLLNDYGFIDNSTNWNLAHSWGNHNSEDYARRDTVTPYTKQQYFIASPLVVATNIDIDLNDKQVSYVTLTTNKTINNPTNVRDGAMYMIAITQGSSNNTVTWSANYEFGDAGAPTLSTLNGKTDFLSFIGDNSGRLFFLGITKGFNNYRNTPPS